MRKFSPSQLGIISESDNIFRIRVVVSDLNSEFRIFFPEVNSDNSEFFFGHSEFSEFFSELIRTIPNFFLEFRIICGKNMEIHQNPVFFTKIFFFSFGKGRTLFSELIFGISCYGPYPWYFDPLPMLHRPPYPWYF